MRDFSIRKSLSCAWVEFVKWICDARMIIVLVTMIFIYNFAIVPLLENAKTMGESLNILEPFIALANSGLILLIIPVVFLTLIADYPQIDTNTVFYISRLGRINWVTGQLIKLVMMDLSYLAVLFVGAVVPMLSRSYVGSSWSRVVTDFLKEHPEKTANFGASLLPENLYFQLTVGKAALQSYLLVFAYLMIIGLILLFFTMIQKKTFGFVACGSIIALGTTFCTMKSTLMWTMPMANSIIWLHYTRFFRKPIMPMGFSVAYLLICIVVLIIFSYLYGAEFSYDNINSSDD